jgi:ABC-type dipeptide/oligopeptide/nickel transport system permease component
VLLFALTLHWLPSSGIGGIRYYVMPAFANCFMGLAIQARQTRSSMLEVMRSDYMVTGRAKGLTQRQLRYKHALPNAMVPIITALGIGFGAQLGGTVIIENVFAIPGIGMYVVKAIGARDYFAIQGAVIFLCIAFSFVMLLTDICYSFVDPRIKAQFSSHRMRRRHA